MQLAGTCKFQNSPWRARAGICAICPDGQCPPHASFLPAPVNESPGDYSKEEYPRFRGEVDGEVTQEELEELGLTPGPWGMLNLGAEEANPCS